MSSGGGIDVAKLGELDALRTRVVTLLQQVSLGMFQIGTELLQAKALLPHGQFGAWVEANLKISSRTAERFMAVTRRLGDKSVALSGFPPGVLYELAAPATPDDVVRRVLSGDIPPEAAAIRAARQGSKPESGSPVGGAADRLVQVFEVFLDKFDEDDTLEEIGLCVASAFACRYNEAELWAQAFARVATAAERAI